MELINPQAHFIEVACWPESVFQDMETLMDYVVPDGGADEYFLKVHVEFDICDYRWRGRLEAFPISQVVSAWS